jgi:hypothetical protein
MPAPLLIWVWARVGLLILDSPFEIIGPEPEVELRVTDEGGLILDSLPKLLDDARTFFLLFERILHGGLHVKGRIRDRGLVTDVVGGESRLRECLKHCKERTKNHQEEIHVGIL